jgi:hypothetical protein
MMSDNIIYMVAVTLLIALAGLAFWIARQSLGLGGGGSLFQNRARRRLGVVENTAVDGRRRLLLVRRDNVEHLIMTGGPVDVVLETGIPLGGARMANGLSDVLSRATPSLESESSYLSGDEPLIIQRDHPN